MKDNKKSNINNQAESNRNGSNWLFWIITSAIVGLSFLAYRSPFIKLNLHNPIDANYIELV
jgi:hypothetical protein